jgi:hypothetical protein
MVAMTVDGPLGEHHIGAFGGELASESLAMRGVDDSAAVVLAGEGGAGPEYPASLAGFGGTDAGTAPEAGSAAEALAAVQVQQNHLMTELGVTGDRSSAAAFRVTRMTTSDDYLEGGRGGPCQERQTGGGAEQLAA